MRVAVMIWIQLLLSLIPYEMQAETKEEKSDLNVVSKQHTDTDAIAIARIQPLFGSNSLNHTNSHQVD